MQVLEVLRKAGDTEDVDVQDSEARSLSMTPISCARIRDMSLLVASVARAWTAVQTRGGRPSVAHSCSRAQPEERPEMDSPPLLQENGFAIEGDCPPQRGDASGTSPRSSPNVHVGSPAQQSGTEKAK